MFLCMWEGKVLLNSTAVCRKDWQVHPLSTMSPTQDIQIQMPLSPRQRWLEGQDPNPDLQLGFTVVGDVFFEFSVSIPVAFHKHQISAAFCQIWFLSGVRYPWTMLSPVLLSFSLTILYLSDFHPLFLYQFQQLFLLYAQCQVLPTPPCLNNSMPSDLFSNSSSEPMMPETSDPGVWVHFSPAVSTHRHSQGAHLPFWSYLLPSLTPASLRSDSLLPTRSKSCFLKPSGKPIISPFATFLSLSLLIP